MTYVKRRFKRRPKDVLVIALRNLLQGEYLLCTQRTYTNIKDKVEAFRESRKDVIRIETTPYGPVMRKIRRVV
jgi:hypothetical protein